MENTRKTYILKSFVQEDIEHYFKKKS